MHKRWTLPHEISPIVAARESKQEGKFIDDRHRHGHSKENGVGGHDRHGVCVVARCGQGPAQRGHAPAALSLSKET